VLVLSLMGLALPSGAQAEDVMPPQVLQARYVILGFDLGERFLTEREAIPRAADLHPDERAALVVLRDQIEDGDRYVITQQRGQAELFIAIRIGRRVALGGDYRPGQLRPGPMPGGGDMGFGMSSGEDMIEVFDCRGSFPGTLLWQAREDDGLRGPSPRLFTRFHDAVEGRK
jgi:hypothetical protein